MSNQNYEPGPLSNNPQPNTAAKFPTLGGGVNSLAAPEAAGQA
jgi:hypothetical protein